MKETERTSDPPRLVAFDMDGTLIAGRVIFTLAHRLGFESELDRVAGAGGPRYARSQRVAKLIAGLSVSEFAEAVDAMPLNDGAFEAMRALRAQRWTVGVISDSYTLATEILARKLSLDFHIANTLVVKEGVITGELNMPMGWERVGCTCRQSVCKRYHLTREAERRGVAMRDTAAVGDSGSDSCMIEAAGTGIWFNVRSGGAPRTGSRVVNAADLRLVSAFLTRDQ